MRSFATDKNRLEKAKKIEAVLKDFLNKEIRNMKVLDMGPGSGLIGDYFSKGNEVYCADLEDRRKDKELTKFLKVKNVGIDIEDCSFDIVISNHVIEHIENQEEHLQEIKRVLKKNFICYIATPNKYFPVEPHYKIPLIHYFPNSIFVGILKILRKYSEPLYLLGYLEMIRIFSSDFEITEYTHKVLKEPKKYGLTNSFAKISKKIPLNILKRLNFSIPTNIFILVKSKQ